ncbi:hypothetical protein [Paenibacillus phocaensis]|uniref:hypothetical protein n=1 Tax=Paenibacillus phocaensis TaxID=1776378 RepID=UPI00039F4C97|nr:hypothetical protein [Paenibacillus phocaensis]
MKEDPAFSPTVQITLDGYFDPGDNQFKGTLQMNGRVYSDMLLQSGFLATHVDGKILRRLGQVYFDQDLGHLAWAVPQSELPPELTNPLLPEAKVWLIAPASSREEAGSLRQTLEDRFSAELRLK